MTQEERIAVLEQNFGTFQKEVKVAIGDLNANGTMLLGLVQHLVHESSHTRFRLDTMELRMGMLETKVDENTRLLYDHAKTLDKHTATLDEHTRILNEHSKTLDEHTRILNEHSKTLDEHTRILNEHTVRFDRLEALIGQVLERLPEAS